MTAVVMSLACVSVLLLYYVYDGYGRLLSVLVALKDNPAEREPFAEDEWPSVTVIVAVFNEQAIIAAKLDDILKQDYPGSQPEIIVANDSSNDGTRSIVLSYALRGIRLVDTSGRQGKSAAQNLAVAEATGEIIILTDADTTMEAGCLQALVAPFRSPLVGCTSGLLQFRSDGGSTIAPDQGLYWKYELKLRRLESELGLLATAAGAIMAVRRRLWIDLPAEYGDDCIIPLDVVLQNQKVIQIEDARAWSTVSRSIIDEFRSRVRMTLRNWTGTWSRGVLLSPVRRPGYACALWSHKILRWLSPFFVVVLFCSTVAIYWMHEVIWPALTVGVFLLTGVIGLVSLACGIRLPIISQLGSFALANTGFAIGIIKSLARKRIRAYGSE